MKELYKKITVGFLLVIFMAVTFGSPIVQGFSIPNNYDLVALLVEQGMYKDTQDYNGLVGSVQSNRIRATTLKARIDQYATNIQKTIPGTRVIIIQVDRYEKPENVRTVLQRLYFDGDPQEPGKTAFLKGVVAIGEVPLPVVNKSGNRFISMFPYTDLEDSAYVFNAKTGDFELNSEVSEPSVEVWHGVIRPPVSTQTEDGRKLLAAYFDKNHLYHIGDDAFASFDKRLFFQDFYNEQKQINPTAYTSYLAYLEHQDDITYSRYTKKLFQELSGAIEQELDGASEDAAAQRAALEAAGVEFDDSVPDSGVNAPGADGAAPSKADIPDILTKVAKMSDALMKRYNEIFSKYPNLVNDFVRYTGRYYVPNAATEDDTDYQSDADSSVNLIAAKDEFTRGYLRLVNDMLEKKIDEVVNQVQRNIPITEVKLKVTRVTTLGDRVITPTAVPELTTTNSDGANDMNDILTACVGTMRAALKGDFLVLPEARCPAPVTALLNAAKGGQAVLDTFVELTGFGGGLSIPDFIIELIKVPLKNPPLNFKGPDSQNIAAADKAFTVNYINFSPQVTINDLAYFPDLWPNHPSNDSAYGRDDNGEQVTLPAHINGVQLDALNSAQQCSLYLGSRGEGAYSKLVEANRAYDLHTAEGYTKDTGYQGLTALEKAANKAAGRGENVQCYDALNNGTCEAYENFGGCFYDSSELYVNPNEETGFNACYPDHATDPVLDRAGTQVVPENKVFDGYDNYYACLNFRPEETLYKHRINIDQIFEKLDDTKLFKDVTDKHGERVDTDRDGTISQRELIIQAVKDLQSEGLDVINPDPTPESQRLVVSNSGTRFTITLADILKGAGWNAAINPRGWKVELADFLLKSRGNSVTVSLQNDFFHHPQAKNATVSLRQEVVKEISSVRTHKEPLKETLIAQGDSLIAKELPVDEPRYVTFQNQVKNPVAIYYPDAFSVKNYDEFLEKVRAVEAQLNAQSLRPDGSRAAPVCNDCLTSLLAQQGEQEQLVNNESVITRANQFKVADAISWKDLDVDSKHVYIAENYLDSQHTAFVTPDREKGYEISYFNGEGDAQGYDLGFNKSLATSSTETLEETEKQYADDPNNPFDDKPDEQEEGGYDLFTWSPPPPSPWFERVKEWQRKISDNTKFEVSFGAEKEKQSEESAKEYAAEAERVKEESNAFVSDPSRADEIQLSRVTKIRLSADSTAAVVGKKVPFIVELLDAKNALVATEFNRIDVTVTGGARVAEKDEDPTTDGTQQTVVGGRAEIAFIAPENPATVTVTVKVNGREDLSKTLSFSILKSATLKFSLGQSAIVADGRGVVPITITAVDDTGTLLTNVNGTVHIALSDTTLARASAEVRLARGRAQFNLTGGVKKGELIINATLSNLDPSAATVTFLPGPATKLVLVKSAEVLIANPGESIDVTAQIFDRFNNLIDTNTGSTISFALSEPSQEFVELSAATATTRNGLATVRALPKEKSGSVTVTAQAPGLRAATLTFDSVKKFGTGSLSRINPESLVTALLGIPAGNISAPKAFGSSLVFSGKTQAVTTLTTSPKQYAKVFEVSDRGALTTDPERVSVNFVPGNHLAFLLRDTRYGVDLAKVYIITKKDGQFTLTDSTTPDKLSDGIYLHQLKNDPAYSFDTKKGSLRISKDDEERIEVQTNGFVKIYDQKFTVRPKKADYLTLEVLEGTTVIAEVYIVQRFNQDVRTYTSTTELSNDAAGVYVQPFALPGSFFFEPTFSGNTTAASLGMALKDRSQVLAGPGRPGFSYNSFEDSLDSMGVGFTQDNKFALLFAAGEIFGEANRPYISDATIVLGDPTVKLGNAPREANFTTDVGTLMYAAKSDVRGLLPFDVNADGFEDLLVVQQDGLIRYLQNGGGVNDFRDRGTLLNVKNGIQDFTKVDINNDRQLDLVVAGKEGCTVDSTCIDIFINNRGSFTRQNVSFNETEKITTLKAADMNSDGFADLVFADTAGDISILTNQRGSFTPQKNVIGNVGLATLPNNNIIADTLVRYANIVERNPDGPQSEEEAENQKYYKTIELTFPNPEAANADPSKIDAPNPVKKGLVEFIYADAPVSPVRHSTKFAQDVNGGVLRNGDVVKYTLTLINNSNSTVSRLVVSDAVAPQLQLNRESITCSNCARGEMQITDMADDPERPFLLSNISIPPNSRRTITYEGTFMQSSEDVEKVTMIIKNDFIDSELQEKLSADTKLDISINKEGNTSGQVLYLISKEEGNRITYEPYKSTVVATDTSAFQTAMGALLNEGAPVSTGEETEVPASVSAEFNNYKSGDSDGDGLQDTLDDINGKLENVANKVQDGVNKLTCDAGCIALPLNAAAFAPGFYSVMGVPGAFDIGLPAFGWGVPSLIPTWPPSGPAQSAGGGRFYVSPTLTGGIGFGLCLGPYGSPKNCYSFGLNPLDLLPGNICDKINGGVQGLIAKANSAVNDLNEGVTASIKPLGGNTSGSSRSGTGLVNYSLGSYEPPVPHKRNKRVPGFPSFLTDWWSAQIEEIIDKATDLPDLYVVYPKISSIAGSVLPTEAFNRTSDPLNNILSWVNSIPLIDIQSSEVNFKVPIITEKEIAKLKLDALQWVEDEKLELKRWQQMMLCGVPLRDEDIENPDDQRAQFLNVELCRLVDLEMNKLITSVVENVKRLDEWQLFPKKILQYRTIKSYYINQVVDYLNTVIEFIGGWVQRNTAIIERWRKSIREMKDVIENYKFIVKLMMDANASCDQCKTERYGLDELVLKLFLAIPKPPVIPLPKLPDIVVDVSKIQAGITIQWPDITFAPEPLIIPKLPRIRLGVNLTIPQFKLILPDIPLLPAPPELPDLPQLPPLQLGKLPDLPPAPTLPDLPASLQATLKLLSQLLRIYCIIKLGFTPTDELLLKTRIEQITARGLTPVLPIDMLLAFQGPSISVKYVDKIIITAFVNLRADMSFIQRAVEAVAEKSNKFTNEFVNKINKYTQSFTRNLEQFTSPTIDVSKDGTTINGKKVNYAPTPAPQVLPPLTAEKDPYSDVLTRVFGEQVDTVDDAHDKISQIFSQLSKEETTYMQQLNAVPEKYVLEAQPVSLEAAKAALNSEGIIRNEEQLASVSPTLQQIITYRNQLTAYAQNTNSESTSLSQLIAESAEDTPRSPFSRYLATTETPTVTSEPEKVASLITQDDAQRIAQAPGDEQLPGADQAGQGGPANTGTINNVGIFYQDSQGEARRLINYTLEANSTNFVETLDADKDGDKEKIYSYGRNIFIKENFSRTSDEPVRPVFRATDIEYTTVYELLKGASAPRDVRVVSESAHDSTISFVVPEVQKAEIQGFDVTTHTSIDAATENDERAPKAVTRFMLEQKPASSVQNETTAKVATVTDIDGYVSAADKPLGKGSALEKGQLIESGADASATLRFDDGTTIDVDENTSFVIPNTPAFELVKGEAKITMHDGSDLFKTGTNLAVNEGKLTLITPTGSSVSVVTGASLTIPPFESPDTLLTRVTDDATITGGTREYISRSNELYHLNAGDMIHPLGTAHVTWAVGSEDEHTYILTRSMLAVPDGNAEGLDIQVEDGVVEVIHSAQKGASAVRTGAVLLPGEKISVKTGAVVVDSRGHSSTLYADQTFALSSIDSLDELSLKVTADPAFYYARITSILDDGSKSVSSAITLLAPQACGDRTVPYANAGASEMTVAVGKEVTIDASRSFDNNGKIQSYELDVDASVDSDRDGDPQNDSDQVHTADHKSFIVGPYKDPGDVKVVLTVFDEAHNPGTQVITIHVVQPSIVLDREPLQKGDITGHIVPKEANVPIVIARLHKDGSAGWELIKTKSANENGQYLTDKNGEFAITDTTLEDGLVLYAADTQIAYINEKTGRITIINDDYEVRALPATAGVVPTRLAVFKKGDASNAKPYTYIYFVPDVNTDVTIDTESQKYTIDDVGSMTGVHVKPLAEAKNQDLLFNVLSGGDSVNPGGVVVRDSNNTKVAVIDVNGDVLFYKNALSLRVQDVPNSRTSQDPVVFELVSNNRVIAEIFFATKGLGKDKVTVIKNPTVPLRPRPMAQPMPIAPSGQNERVDQPFADISANDPFNVIIKKLYERGIVAGYATNTPGVFEYRPDQNIARSEFTQIVMKMLCITPRDEARRLPTPFYDVGDPRLWFYPVLKEGSIRGFIKGYLGEALRDKNTGALLTPFKPANSITRAEATTVVLAALDEQKVIDLKRADLRAREGEQWYDPYLRVAVNLTPYLIRPEDGALRPFLLTREEALRPTDIITRRDFAVMADRVLLIRDCGNPAVSGADDAGQGDTNAGQGSPQPAQGSDQGDNGGQNGVDAGDEGNGGVTAVTNTEGIFVVDMGCANECPCRSRIAPLADLSSGDTIFAAIAGPNGVPIYAKSNEEKYP